MNDLVLALDAANLKSFKGVNATNILTTITYGQSDQNSALYKSTNGEETVYIPSLGIVTSKYVDFYNDYNGGSGVCCPNLYSYGTGLIVSPNTTYTYSIIYKTTSGYSHPNYMYRYEYTSGGSYVTESGVHSTDNRTSLGDGWWFAWGQFTTQATTGYLNTYLFHYEYGVQNRVYVYRAALYQGTYIIPPEHMLTSGQVRGTTVATGGGWVDLSGSGNNGELANGPTYSSSNGGSLIFDGSNDFVLLSSNTTFGNNTTWEAWIYSTGDVSSYNMFMGRFLPYFGFFGGNSLYFSNNIGGSQRTIQTATNLSYNTWYHATFTAFYDGANTTMKIYTNGVETATGTWSGTQVNYSNPFMIGDGNNGSNGTWYPFQGRISNVKIYNRTLSTSEIQQNFNALRGRFGI
jgi:hypothetical protein